MPTKSWRDLIKVHPAADLFPMMSPDELAQLGEDIRKHGLIVPAIVWRAEENAPLVLLDGRNRLDALELIGESVLDEEGGGISSMFATESDWRIDEDPYEYVIALNIRRRHLTAEQKRELIEKLIKADPAKSSRQIARTIDASPTTVVKVRDELIAKGDVSRVDTSTDTLGRKQPTHKPPPASRPTRPPASHSPATDMTTIVRMFATDDEGGAGLNVQHIAYKMRKGGVAPSYAAGLLEKLSAEPYDGYRAERVEGIGNDATWRIVAEADNTPPGPQESDEPRHYSVAAWNALDTPERRRLIATAVGKSQFNWQDTDSIEWARWSWNPVEGCLHNCPYCYARDIANRFFEWKFDPVFLPSRLTAPGNTKVPKEAATEIGLRNVFVTSMGDLFGKWVPEDWIQAVFDQVRANPHWNFLFLTKFPQRLAERQWPANAWCGTTVDTQARVKIAERAFRDVKAGVRWLSVEPMMERLTFTSLEMFNWIVIGGATKSTQTPAFDPPMEWVTHLLNQACAAGIEQVYAKANLKALRGYPTKAFEAPADIADEAAE